MKRFFSIVLSLTLMLTMAVTAFAADSANFKVTLVSENKSQAVITIDYDGGSAYSCLDMEIVFSSRLTIASTEKGSGLKNFLAENENSISTSNVDGNRFISAFASIDPFKVVKGKDLYKITLKKTSGGNLTKNDVKVNVTNCGLLKSGTTDITMLKSSIAYGFVNAPSTTVKKTSATKNTTETTTVGETTTKTGETTTVAETTVENSESLLTEEFEPNYDSETYDSLQADTDEEKDTKSVDRKKIIVIAAAAICCLLVIGAVIIYIVKKTKSDVFKD